MNNTPIIIKGGGLLQHGSNVYESKSDITLKITDETEDKSTITRGIYGKKFLSRKAEIKFTPLKWTSYTSLFAILSVAKGAQIFGAENTATYIWGADGQKFVLPRTAITGIPSIGAGVKKELLGEFTITALQDPTVSYDDLSGLFSRTSATMPSLPTLSGSDLASTAFIGQFTASSGSDTSADFDFDFEDGAEISFDIKTTDESTDRLGLFDMTLEDFTPKAKFKPSGISYAEFDKLAGISTGAKRGGIVSGGFNLTIRGIYSGDPVFTLKNAVCSDREMKWSNTDKRFGELELTALGEMGVDKFAVSSSTADFEITAED